MRKLMILCCAVLFAAFGLAACTPSAGNGAEQIVYTVSIDEEKQFVLKGETAFRPAAPQKEGYIFLGWYENDNEYDFSTPVESDKIIISRWTEQPKGISGMVKNVNGKVENALVTLTQGKNSFTDYTDSNGLFEFETAVTGACAVLIEKEGYISAYKQFSDPVFYNTNSYVGEVALNLAEADLGEFGGTNSAAWHAYATRGPEALEFRFVSEDDLLHDNNVGLFINYGDVTGTARSADTFLFQIFAGGDIRIYNYPSNAKKTVATGSSPLLGITTVFTISENSGELKLTIPYSVFGLIQSGKPFGAKDIFGLSFTSDNASTGKWDVWCRDDLLGADNDWEVDRENLKDYLRISSYNVLFDCDNNHDTVITGNAGQGGVRVSSGGYEAITGSAGDFKLSFKRNGSGSAEIRFDKTGYEDDSVTLPLTDSVNCYTLEATELQARSVVLSGTATDYETGEPIEDVLVSVNELTAYTDADGAFSISGVPANVPVTVTFEKSGYYTLEQALTVEDLNDPLLGLEVKLTEENLLFTLNGKVAGLNGSVANALITVENTDYSAFTDSNGEYVLELTAADYTVTVSKSGFENAAFAITAADFLASEEFSVNLPDVDLMLNFVDLGSLGSGVIWDAKLTRSSGGFEFVFATGDEITEAAILGVYIFVGELNTNLRNDRCFMFSVDDNEKIEIFHYPQNVKTRLSALLPSPLPSGVSADWTVSGNDTIVSIFIPYGYFATVNPDFSVDPLDAVGLSLTVNEGAVTYAWEREDMLGHSGSAEVVREWPADHIFINSFNVLFLDHEYSKSRFSELVESGAAYKNGYSLYDNMAELSSLSATPGALSEVTLGDTSFSDRPAITITGPIDAIIGLKYYKESINGASYSVEKAGYVILITSGTTAYDTLNSTLKNAGWVLPLYRYGRILSVTEDSNYYVKWCDADETLNYGKWFIPLFMKY